MKKKTVILTSLLVTVLACALCAGLLLMPEPTFDGMAEAELEPYFDLVRRTVKDYAALRVSTEGYTFSADTGVTLSGEAAEALAALPLSGDLREFLTAKLQFESATVTAKGDWKTLNFVECEIIRWEVVDGVLICDLSITADYRHSDGGPSSLSGEGSGSFWKIRRILC